MKKLSLRFVILFSAMSCFLLGSCGKQGPYGFQKGDDFEYYSDGKSTSFEVVGVGEDYIIIKAKKGDRKITLSKDQIKKILNRIDRD